MFPGLSFLKTALEVFGMSEDPKFYYVIRLNGDVVGVHRSINKYRDNAMLGAYTLDPITMVEAETLQAFGVVDGFGKDSSPDHK
jgi:hypothetical protein